MKLREKFWVIKSQSTHDPLSGKQYCQLYDLSKDLAFLKVKV